MRPEDAARLDRRALGRHFERAGPLFDARAVLVERVRGELLARLDLVAFEPRVVLDLGCGTGHGARALKRRWPRATVLALDRSPAMLHQAAAQSGLWRRFARLRADAGALPIASGAVDLVFSCLMLPALEAPDAAFAEVRRILGPRGYFTFATLGPDTLKELRAAWAAADDDVHVHRFLDMHDVGDALARAGFADPVMDVERLTLTYPDVRALAHELRALGARNALAARRRGLTGRRRWASVERQYARDPDGRLPATCEVVYGQAWCPGTTPPLRARRGEVVVPLERLRRR